MPAFCESLGPKIEVIKQDAFYHLMTQKLDPNQMIVISGLFTPQLKEVLQTIQTFVNEGGRLIILNSASHVIASLFPGKIQTAPPSTTIQARAKFVAEKDLFSGYTYGDDLLLEYYRYPIDIIDKQNVKVLAQVQGQTVEPLLVKFNQGNGSVVHFISRMFTTEKKVTDIDAWLKSKGAEKATFIAWNCAEAVGYKNGLALAIQTHPSQEVLLKVLSREYQALQTYFQQNPQEIPQQEEVQHSIVQNSQQIMQQFQIPPLKEEQ